jgi:polyhydroxyalkanoate synthase subunit PhaC
MITMLMWLPGEREALIASCSRPSSFDQRRPADDLYRVAAVNRPIYGCSQCTGGVMQNWTFPMLSMSDALRRSLGRLMDDAGLAPQEAPWHSVLQQSDLQLRRYGQHAGEVCPVLIVPAPIKRPYIFDLLPDVSVVRRLADAGCSVYLSEWREEGSGDLGRSLSSLRTAIETIANEHRRAPIVVGHSLGGTLAAIVAALEPQRIGKLVLIEAPLRFGQSTGALRPIALFPSSWLLSSTVGFTPGSLLDLASVAAAPEEFVLGRWSDAWASLPDLEALAIHARVIRWSLDEFGPPARLIQEVVDLLYGQDRFARNELCVLGRSVRSDSLAEIPIAAIVDHTSRLVPSSSALEPLSSPTIFQYRPEIGVGFQHVGPLVGRRAHREIWPHVIDWMRCPPSPSGQTDSA